MFAILSWFWSILTGTLNAVAKVVMFCVLVIAAFAIIGMVTGDGLPKRMVLELDLRGPLPDKVASSPFDFGQAPLSVMDVVMGLDAAERDARVAGVFVRVGTGSLSVPKAQEVRDALKHFRASGKFVIVHAQGFNSGGLGDYVVAAAADEIWMQPVSVFFPAGTATGTVFLKGFFDKINAVPQFVQRYEYKNAANIFTQTDFTPAHREATMRLLQSWYDTATQDMADDRRMDRAALTAFLDASPAPVEEVKNKGLINTIGYDDDARHDALARAGKDAKMAPFEKFVRVKREMQPAAQGPRIAFVHAAGDIVEGADGSGFDGGLMIGGDSMAEAIRQATKDPTIKAILLRVDSPGGSALASDQILDALKKAKAAGKPVVVSMGSVAASGGYYISLAADRIVAEPGTITGSIGVVFGKVAIGRSLELLGIEGRNLGIGRNALFLSGLEPWDAAQLAKVDAQADQVYDDFTRKVALGRNLPLARVQEIARGRVWTGADAKDRGLVDELGGFWTAVSEVKRLAKIGEGTHVVFVPYPRPGGFFERFARAFGDTEAGIRALQGLSTLVQSEPVRTLIDAVESAPDGRAQLRATGLPGGSGH